MSVISFLKKPPIDVGQANLKHTTAGKQIAFSFIQKAKKGGSGLDIGRRDDYWSETGNIEDSVRFANTCAAEVVRHIGVSLIASSERLN